MTTDERLAAIRRRTTQLRAQEARRRARLLDGLCLAACLALVVCLGAWMPLWDAGLTAGATVLPTTGAAALVQTGSAASYILMGLLCFGLGVCLTLLLSRLHRRAKPPKEPRDDEL